MSSWVLEFLSSFCTFAKSQKIPSGSSWKNEEKADENEDSVNCEVKCS